MTLSLLQDLLNTRLRPDFRRIWVNGTNNGRSRLCFTIFNSYGYEMIFTEIGSLRQFRSDGDFDYEVNQLERLIESFDLLDFIQ